MAMKILPVFSFPLYLAVLVLAFATKGAEVSVDELLDQAGVSFAKGMRENAIELANNAIAAEPKNARAYYVRGRFHAELRQVQKAMDDFNRALLFDPRLAPAYRHRGEEHFALGH